MPCDGWTKPCSYPRLYPEQASPLHCTLGLSVLAEVSEGSGASVVFGTHEIVYHDGPVFRAVLVQLWPTTDPSAPTITLRGHEDRICGLDWHPDSGRRLSPSGVNLVTGSGDTTLKLWSMESQTPLATMYGHVKRLGQVAFHPSGTTLSPHTIPRS